MLSTESFSFWDFVRRLPTRFEHFWIYPPGVTLFVLMTIIIIIIIIRWRALQCA